MSHPLYWPTKYYFYPIGNTSAVSLTRDLPPEENANVLVLGCGDPRNVLYTLFCEPATSKRRLDFTCCDFDPAVLARNVILLSMASDKVNVVSIWNIFFHAYLDNPTRTLLLDHCTRLFEFAESLSSWNNSPYGKFIRMSTEQTLKDLRRHWKLYVDFPSLPSARSATVTAAFAKSFKGSKETGIVWSTARSAGPLAMNAVDVCSEQFSRWWKTGVTFAGAKGVAAAKLVNPTFVYSLAGEGANFHYGTDPLMPFHLAPMFGNVKTQATVDLAVNAAKEEFEGWCAALQRLLSGPANLAPIVRFFAGEATALCRALAAFASTNSLSIGIPVAQWRTHMLALDKQEYVVQHAPVLFNVIETSNLDDHLGLLNILVATTPVLSTSPSSALYTESLLFDGEDATKDFSSRLHGDITIIGLLTGLHPIDFLSGFTSRSNSHEVMFFMMTRDMSRKRKDTDISPQYHQVTTWKMAASLSGVDVAHTLPKFDPYQLGTFLFDMYHSLFENEDSMTWFRKFNPDVAKKEVFLKALTRANMIHYNRETFALFAKVVRDRLRITSQLWSEVMTRFFALVEADSTMPMDTVNRQDLWTHMYRNGLYTAFFFNPSMKYPKIGRFEKWETLPTLVRIILVVPRDRFNAIEESDGTPILQCHVRGPQYMNAFASVHAAYGTVTSTGTKSNPRVLFNEDPNGKSGTSPLVVSFTMSTYLLTSLEPQKVIQVCLSVRSTPATFNLTTKLGINLDIFSAGLLDEKHVFVLPEQPLPQRSSPNPLPSSPAGPKQIGEVEDVLVQLDDDFEFIFTLSRKLLVQDEAVKRRFGQESATPVITQVQPCVIRVSVDDTYQDLLFPFPVIGSKNKLRLARKSLYIEVLVPVFGPYKTDGMKLGNFPVIGSNKAIAPWNIHRLDLSSAPSLNSRVPKALLKKWFEPHVGSIMSTRERTLRKTHEDDGIMLVKDTLHTLFVRSTGVQGGAAKKVFALADDSTHNCDTVLFISGLKFDVGSHTMVCDGYVMPLTHLLMNRIQTPFVKLHESGIANIPVYKSEMKTWKHLLPAFAERCRSWEHTSNCEYISQGKVPLTEVMEDDPLCSCGKGKGVEGMTKDKLWIPFVPYVTRVALSPLFAVSYLETIGRDPEKRRCFLCRGQGKPKIKVCTGCQKVRYCSPECQKKDWKAHKPLCKA